ncbi:ETS-related transcription factor Elf-5-like isoform X2 [Bacillus rossius redtenbacheri]
MTKGFEASFQSHTYENNNSPFCNFDDMDPLTNYFLKGDEMLVSNKLVDLDDFSYDIKAQSWRQAHPREWSELDSMTWVMSALQAEDLRCEDVDISQFRMRGEALCGLGRPGFQRLDRACGDVLFARLAELCREAETLAVAETFITLTTRNAEEDPWPKGEEQAYPKLGTPAFDCENEKLILPQTAPAPSETRPAGKPKSQSRRRSAKKSMRLWEFIRNMLHDPRHCPKIIQWVDHDKGLFKFVRSDEVAKVWAEHKKNPKMNYEKLSRAMRYYYKSKVFMAVEHQRLVYRFGPNAKGWQTENPNFEKPIAKL